MKKYLLSIALCSVSLVCQAGFNEGVTAYEKGDYQTALKAWKAIAEQKSTVTGDFEWHSSASKDTVEAQYALALLYWQGKGIAQNYQEAEKWLVLAATSGHSEAQLKLAYLYLEGLSGKANIAEASKWFEQSAQQGNVNAQYNLGVLYWRGSGMMQDATAAKKWLTAAASQGDVSAKELLVEIKAASVQTAANNNDQFKMVDAQSPAITPKAQPTETPAPASLVAQSNEPQVTEVQTLPVATQLTVMTPAVTAQTTDVFSTPSAPLTDYYAVQLIGSPKQKDVQQFMESWRDTLNPLIMTDKIKKSERIFVVVYGSYASTEEAKQAITDLPSELRKNKPWIVKMHGDVLAP